VLNFDTLGFYRYRQHTEPSLAQTQFSKSIAPSCQIQLHFHSWFLRTIFEIFSVTDYIYLQNKGTVPVMIV
jgi:hypothetical protein